MDDLTIDKQVDLVKSEMQGIIYKYHPYASLTALLSLGTVGLTCTGASDEAILEILRDLLQHTREEQLKALNNLPDTPTADLIRSTLGKPDKFDE